MSPMISITAGAGAALYEAGGSLHPGLAAAPLLSHGRRGSTPGVGRSSPGWSRSHHRSSGVTSVSLVPTQRVSMRLTITETTELENISCLSCISHCLWLSLNKVESVFNKARCKTCHVSITFSNLMKGIRSMRQCQDHVHCYLLIA